MKSERLLGTIIVAALVAYSGTATILEVRTLLDPCMTWGETGQTVLRPNGQTGIISRGMVMVSPCESRSSSAFQTKQFAVMHLLFFQGTTFAAALFAMIGTLRSRPRFCLASSVLLGLVAFGKVLMGQLFPATAIASPFALLALASSVGFVVVARRIHEHNATRTENF